MIAPFADHTGDINDEDYQRVKRAMEEHPMPSSSASSSGQAPPVVEANLPPVPELGNKPPLAAIEDKAADVGTNPADVKYRFNWNNKS